MGWAISTLDMELNPLTKSMQLLIERFYPNSEFHQVSERQIQIAKKWPEKAKFLSPFALTRQLV